MAPAWNLLTSPFSPVINQSIYEHEFAPTNSTSEEEQMVKRKRRLRLVALAACLLLVAACSDGSGETTTTAETGSETTSTAGGEETTTTAAGCDMSVTHSADEVSVGAEPQSVTPVYAVPKCFEDDPTLAFLMIDQSIPILFEFVQGMEAAADFYGVELLITDLRNQPADTLNQYEALSARSPDVVGTSVNTSDAALAERARADGVAVVLSGFSFSDPPADAPALYNDNVDAAIGAEVGHMIGEEAAARLEGEWAGKEVVFIGVGHDPLPQVEARITASLEAAREHVEIADDNIFRLTTEGNPETAQNMTTDVLTANPDAVFVMAPLNDETGVGAVQAVRNAGRQGDAVISLWGGGSFGRDAMRNDTDGIIIGVVYQNAFSDGWTWVEAAIATFLGDEFGERASDFPRVTKENVDELFPND
jgi:ABC-type sugar transport system substrate-binding protein